MMRHEKMMRALLQITAAVALLSGCASSTMQTQRQLERGDVVLSGAADAIGTLVIPRVSGQATLGLGPGDVSAHVGSSALAHNIGISGRYYPTPGLIMKLDSNASYVPNGQSLLLYGSAQLSRAVRTRRGVYAGLVVSTSGISHNAGAQWHGVNMGAMVGLDLLQNKQFGIQLEARFEPLMLNEQGRFGAVPLIYLENGVSQQFNGQLSMGQIGIGFYKRLAHNADSPSPSPWSE